MEKSIQGRDIHATLMLEGIHVQDKEFLILYLICISQIFKLSSINNNQNICLQSKFFIKIPGFDNIVQSVNLLYNQYIRIDKAMNEFISPHQNININISYNLGQQEKIPKVVFGKKIAKIVKSTMKQQTKPFYKTFKKSQEHATQQEQPKKAKSNKKIRTKKKSNILLTLPDQQQIVPRRLKTQGNIKAELNNFIGKKEHKNNSKQYTRMNTQHFKSVNNPPLLNTRTIQVKKPTTSLSKAKKQQRRHANKSCILYQPKKNLLLSDVQHIISTNTAGPTPSNKQPKKRVNSATVIKSDKFVNKLLDMSVLVSQLGGSIPMNEEKNNQNTNNRIKAALQGFMNSIDLKIIKKMEQDNHSKRNILVDMHIADGLDIIMFLNKIRRIPLDKLNQKATKIQRFWRKKTSESVVPYYSNMFFRNPAINLKIGMQNNLKEISGIQINNLQQEEQYQSDHNILSMSNKYKIKQTPTANNVIPPIVSQTLRQQFQQQSISAAKIKKMMQLQSSSAKYSNTTSHRNHQIQQISQKNQNLSFNQNDQDVMQRWQKQQEQQSRINFIDSSVSGSRNSRSLNIQKYKQLVKQSIEQNKQKSNKNSKQFNQKSINYDEQSQKFNHEEYLKMNKDKRQSKQPGTQSAHWNHVHNILSTNMNRKVPVMSKTVLQQLMKQSVYNKQWVQGEFSNSQSRKISQKSSPRQHLKKQKNKQQTRLAKELAQQNYYQQQSLLHSQSQQAIKDEYNWNKYSDISKLKKPQQIVAKKKYQDFQDRDIIANDQKNKKQKDNQLDGKWNIINNQQEDSKIYEIDIIPGLLPSGIRNSMLDIDDYVQEQDKIPLKNHNHNTKQQYNKDEKWLRQKLVIQGGIVQNYLDCGLDYFGLKIPNKQTISNLTAQEAQQHEVQQKQQHKQILKRDHHHKTSSVSQQNKIQAIKKVKQENNNKKKNKQPKQHKQDDIFSSEGHSCNDDIELVYVFNNSQFVQQKQDKKQIDIQNAAKNKKRNDNIQHLGIREDHNQDRPVKKYTMHSIQPNYSFEPSFRTTQNNPQPLQNNYTLQQQQISQQLSNKRKQKITQSIITKLIQQFAYDVSLILRKTHNDIDNKNNGNNRLYPMQSSNLNSSGKSASNGNSLVNSSNAFGIQTNFQSIRDFIIKLKEYVLGNQDFCRKIIQNLSNNIGPTSKEILSYLRIEEQNQYDPEAQNQAQQEDNQQWLFVIPNDLFQIFHKKLIEEQQQARSKKLSNKFKLYTQFWYRSIFQCFNQCLDYQRPYGITGAPYAWICQPKLPRLVTYSKKKVQDILQNAQNRLLQLSSSCSGIIFDKPQSPYRQLQISQQDKTQINQQKISRMLANQILDDEYNWITYNDQITQLLVDISRKIQELLIFQVSTDLKKIARRRKMMVHIQKFGRFCKADVNQNKISSEEDEQHAVFLIQDLI